MTRDVLASTDRASLVNMTTSLRMIKDEADAATVEAQTGDVVHRFTFTNGSGGWCLTEVTTSCGDGLGSADIRSTPLSLARAHFRGDRTDSASIVKRVAVTDSASTDTSSILAYHLERGRLPQRRERWSEVELAELAGRYVDLVGDGLGRPTARLSAEYAAELGATSFSAGRMRALLAQARREGLLTKTKGRTAGGRLTSKAERLLSDVEQ